MQKYKKGVSRSLLEKCSGSEHYYDERIKGLIKREQDGFVDRDFNPINIEKMRRENLGRK